MATDPAGSAEAGETRQGERQTPDLSRFLIRSPSQIGQVLRALSEHAEIVTAYFNRGREFLLTAIVDVDVQGGTVLLDQGSDEALNQKLLASDRVVLVSAHDKVKVQFSVKQVRAAMHEGRPALAIDLPPEMLKLQRREFFRIRTSVQAPVRCRLQVSEGQVLDLSALDISIGGIAVHATLPAERSQIGARFPGTRMQVGEEGTLTVELELRNCNEVRLRNGLDTARLGLSFIDMRESEQKVVQRYILKTERDRRSRENALG